MAKLIDKALEEAITNLPVKEKNKLLLRLINKDKMLVEQLRFKLLEHPEIDLQLRQDAVSEEIQSLRKLNAIKSRELLILQRSFFAKILYHKRITSDKIGEVRLSLKLILKFLKDYNSVFNKDDYRFNFKLNEFTIKKTLMAIKNLKALHEDYRIEFEEDINLILSLIYRGIHANLALSLGLPRNMDE